MPAKVKPAPLKHPPRRFRMPQAELMGLYVPGELLTEIQEYAAREYMSASAYIRRLLLIHCRGMRERAALKDDLPNG